MFSRQVNICLPMQENIEAFEERVMSLGRDQL